MKTIYDLKLHEGITTEFGIFIMRVAGGWIYNCWDFEKDCFINGLFIPLNNEFQQNNIQPYPVNF